MMAKPAAVEYQMTGKKKVNENKDNKNAARPWNMSNKF